MENMENKGFWKKLGKSLLEFAVQAIYAKSKSGR